MYLASSVIYLWCLPNSRLDVCVLDVVLGIGDLDLSALDNGGVDEAAVVTVRVVDLDLS